MVSTHSIQHDSIDSQVLIVQDEGHAVPGKVGKGETGSSMPEGPSTSIGG